MNSSIFLKEIKKIINTSMQVQENTQECRNESRTESHSLQNTMWGFKSRLDMVEEMVNEKN